MEKLVKPVIDGLFDLTEKKLIGSKCTSCGTYYFPQSPSCSNPDCDEKKVEPAFLSPKGKLYSYTIQYYTPPPPFKFEEPFEPYAIGLVELPEKIRVLGILAEKDFEKLKVGMDLELEFAKLYEEDGVDHITWNFRSI
jgi:uncharacterized OB-fold protein